MSRPVVRDTDKGFREIMAALRDLEGGRHVVVGIRQQNGALRLRRTGAPGSRTAVADASAPTMVQIATVNEFGGGNVPERSFMRSTFDENRSKYERRLQRFLMNAVNGKYSLDHALGLTGQMVVRDVKVKIRDLRDPPNAPITIKLKGSSNPLIDTGRMRQSIDFEVRGGRS